MTGKEYREAIETLGMSRVGAARFLGVAESTCGRWMSESHPVPVPVAMLLQLMISLELTPHHVLAIMDKVDKGG